MDFDADRFEPARNAPGSYAQINLECHDSPWGDTLNVLGQIGPKLLALKHEGALSNVSLDVAFTMTGEAVAITRSIPNDVVKLIGSYGIDLDVSIYLSGDTS